MAEQATQPTKETQRDPLATPMAEAGFSMNVKMLDPNGAEVMLTFRCPLATQSAKLINHYSQTIDDLLKSDWKVSHGGARPAANGASNAPVENGAPVCRVHNVAMRESKNRPGSYYCSKKVGDDYCKEKA